MPTNHFINRLKFSLKRNFFSCISIFAFGLLIRSTGTFAQAFNFRNISIQNGLPQSQAYAIVFDNQQQAWIGTQGGGVCRYDGTDFLYLTKNDSLLSNRIFSIAVIRDDIWIGQRGGVSVFSNEGTFRFNYRLTDPDVVVNDLVEYNGRILVATSDNVYELFEGNFEPQMQNQNLINTNCTRFFLDQDSILWVCTTSGLLNFDDPFSKLNRARGLPVDQVECVAIFQDKWLIGTYGGGLSVYDKEKGIMPFTREKGYSKEIITSLFIPSSGEIWVGTLNNGIYVYGAELGEIRNYRTENGLANNNIRTILKDKWNNIWIGTSGGGISIFQNSPFIKYTSSSGLNGNYVYSVINDQNDNIWVGTEGTGIVRINDTSVTLFDEDLGFCSDKVRSMLLDTDGDIWFATESMGIGIYAPGLGKDTIVRYTHEGGLTSDWIKSIVQNPNSKEIFIATVNGGILRVSKGADFPFNVRFSKLRNLEGELPDRVNYLFFREGKLWYLGDENKYGYIDGKKVFAFEVPNVNFRNAVVRDNKIWFGTFDNGVMRLDLSQDSSEQKSWITTSEGISSNTIFQLLADEKGIWVGSEKGLDRLILNERDEVDSIIHYGSAEGFDGLETNSNASFTDHHGNHWFGTVNGLFSFVGVEINYAQKQPPYLILRDFRIFYESIEKTPYASYFDQGKMVKELKLPYDQNHIGFSFKAIHYTHSENIRYSWKLSGIDRDWTPPSTSHEATYGNLPPGTFTFQVKASIDNNWDVDPVTIAFEIDQPYWQKWWFRWSVYAAVFIAGGLIFLYFFLRQRRKNKILREKLEMEKNLIELEQKALRLQMNPHFIFNVLNSIHNLIILNDPDKARYALAKFSKLMRRVLENSRQKFISLDDEIETLENYVQLERLTGGVEVELNFEVDPGLDPGEEILPPLMIQPFIENALIHGLRNLDRPGLIRVKFRLVNDHLLECCIEDNGRGRERAEEIKAQKESYHRSTALEVTAERLASLNKNEVFVPFEIIDLKDKNGLPSGTRVVIRISI